jgi:hypothetical protein
MISTIKQWDAHALWDFPRGNTAAVPSAYTRTGKGQGMILDFEAKARQIVARYERPCRITGRDWL